MEGGSLSWRRDGARCALHPGPDWRRMRICVLDVNPSKALFSLMTTDDSTEGAVGCVVGGTGGAPMDANGHQRTGSAQLIFHPWCPSSPAWVSLHRADSWPPNWKDQLWHPNRASWLRIASTRWLSSRPSQPSAMKRYSIPKHNNQVLFKFRWSWRSELGALDFRTGR